MLDRLTEVGLIDDAAFAQQWVRSRHTYSGKGKKVLAEELRRKGIAPEDAEPALESVTAEDENARAGELVRRKLTTLSPDLDRDKAISRLVAMLARRGYTPGTAYEVVTGELAALATRRAQEQPPDTRSSPAPAPAGRAKPTASRRELAADDTDSAAELVRTRLRTLSPGLDRDSATRRLVGLLARRGYSPGTAYQVVAAELAASGALHISERTGARREQNSDSQDENSDRMASSPMRRAKVGPRGRTVLGGRDLDESDSEEPASETDSPEDEQIRAAELVRAKLRTLPRDLDRDKAIRRLVGLLARRGFSQSTAYSVVKSELAANGFDA